MCEGVLGDEGVLELCELGEFRLSLVPLEVDVVTMELDRSFRECKLEGNNSSLQGTSVTQLTQTHAPPLLTVTQYTVPLQPTLYLNNRSL